MGVGPSAGDMRAVPRSGCVLTLDSTRSMGARVTTSRAQFRRGLAATGLASAVVLATIGLAHADTVRNAVASSGVGVGGSTTITSGESKDIKYYVDASGSPSGCVAGDGTGVTVTITAEAGSGVVLSSATLIGTNQLFFDSCGSASSEFQTVTFTSSTLSTGGGWHISTTSSDPGGNAPNAGLADFNLKVVAPVADPDPCAGLPDADGDGVADTCDTNSYAPQVGDAAGNADGLEGTPGDPTTSGSFTDQDGNGTLALSIGATDAGTLIPDGSGGFTWSHTTTDDDSGTVTVTASDGEHADASQTFSWSADNVDPVIGTIATTPSGPCSVGLSASYGDQGSGDTHSAAIAWGDGDTSSFADPTSSPVAGSHTYTANGSYTINVTVTDDDGGSDSDDAASTFATKNTAGGFLQPINAAGTRSVFKLGSTIPLKVLVTGCDGLAATGLAPTITVIKVDSSAGDAVNETTVSTSSPTSGVTMRWTGEQYLYNLSTKNSQMSNLPSTLTAGTYTITATDPSFYAPVSATGDLKK
jgi:hypothetical protein